MHAWRPGVQDMRQGEGEPDKTIGLSRNPKALKFSKKIVQIRTKENEKHGKKLL